MQRKTARADTDGNFEIRGLAVGGYTLYARFRRSDGSSGSIRKTIEVHEAVRQKRVTLKLGR